MLWFAAFVMLARTGGAQSPSRGFPKPPPSMDPQTRAEATASSSPATSRRPDLAQAQREAEDLARIAQTIPADVTKIREGMLPKDVSEKLKQIERMSKHLRTQLSP